MTRVSYAVEGRTDEVIAERLIRHVGHDPWRRYSGGGKSGLDPKVAGYNRSATRQPWLVLRDLDHDAPCPSALVTDLLGNVSPLMAFRIAVRSAESWLLADRAGFAQFFKVPIERVPIEPDLLDDPKRSLVDLCRRSSSSSMRQQMVPTPRGGRMVGPEYEATIGEFARERWQIDGAVRSSPSLRRAVNRLRSLSCSVW